MIAFIISIATIVAMQYKIIVIIIPFLPCRTMDVLISLNNGKSFISTPYTITASTCVSSNS